MTLVKYSTDAQSDFVDIAGYIALDSENQAIAFVERLRNTADRIALSPRIYRQRDDIAPGLRAAPVGNYLLLFRIIAGGIEVVRAVHGGRDLNRLFESD